MHGIYVEPTKKYADILVNGGMKWLTVGDSENVLAFVRTYGDRNILVIINISGKTVETDVAFKIGENAKTLMQKDIVIKASEENTCFAACPGGYAVIEM